jgi:hypothetical protein
MCVVLLSCYWCWSTFNGFNAVAFDGLVMLVVVAWLTGVTSDKSSVRTRPRTVVVKLKGVSICVVELCRFIVNLNFIAFALCLFSLCCFLCLKIFFN